MSRFLVSSAHHRNVAVRRTTAGQTLIGLLVVIVIIGILAVIMIPQIAGRHHAQGQALTPRERGYQAACGVYESQINQAIMMYKMDHNHNPPSLDALKKYGLTNDMIHAPDCVFQYDPSTGIASNTAEGAQGVNGVVNPTGQEQSGAGPPQAAPAASPYASHSIAPPGAAVPARLGGPAGGSAPAAGGNQGGGTALPGGLHIPNVGGGMGGGGDGL